MEEVSRDIAQALLDIGAVKISIDPPFQWVSGIKSPVYCDNRMLISHPETRDLIVKAFAGLIDRKVRDEELEEPDYIAGTATAAIPWAAFLAYELGKPMVYIRPEKKKHGTGKQIEGDLRPGSKVLIMEDLISTGGSCIKAAQAVKEEGRSEVIGVFAIVTWELAKSVENFNRAGLYLKTLTNFTELVGLAVEQGQIAGDNLDNIYKFNRDPQGWWESFK
ncbi:MAG: orotate phosphoribosyltransferase [Patescibacteria group bacterium]|nr:orotate phosphoribosyltransferase [Patescibacteria group bacterium]